MKIELAVRHKGPVPSLKNHKRVIRGMLITEPKVKRWMEEVISDFESQLFCATRTTAGAILTTPHPHSSIVSSLPLDDSRQWISELLIVSADVDKGQDGATITIEEIL